MKKTKMRIAAAVLAGCMCLSGTTAAFAASYGPGVQESAQPDSISQDEWEKLQDQVIEYREIGQLVEYFNPTYKNVKDSIAVNYQPYEEASEQIRGLVRETMNDVRAARDQGAIIDEITYTMTREAEKSAAKAYETVVKTIKSSTRSTLNQVRKQLTSGVQQLMIGYQQAESSLELLNTAVELSEASYQSYQTQRSLGMATDLDVENAKQNLLSARQSLTSLNNTLISLKHNLNLMVGKDFEADTEIGKVPEPDLTLIDTMNPEEDLDRAINNNYTYIASRKSSGKSTAAKETKNRTLDAQEQQIQMTLNADYQAVLKSKADFEAAKLAMEAADRDWQGNQTKYQLGMLGKLQFLQTKMLYLQNKMSYDAAVLTLQQAMETYYWDTEGLISVQ